jgi:hypothetical protein
MVFLFHQILHTVRERACRLCLHLLQICLLLWIENADGHIHLHADAGDASYRESQLPGFVKVTMSRDKGVGIGPHQFKPLKGSLAFSLIQIGERWYYEVIEQLPSHVKVSYVDAVTGVLSDPKTGRAASLD